MTKELQNEVYELRSRLLTRLPDKRQRIDALTEELLRVIEPDEDEPKEYVETYRELKIFRDSSGYSAQNGWEYAADNAQSLAEARAEIDAYWALDQHGPLNGIFPPGTPPS